MKQPLHQRIWKYVNKTETCWLWTGSINNRGYGKTSDGTRDIFAHRAVYEFLIGPIPFGLQLDHLCRVKACVNPGHLEPVTHAENLRRGRQWESEKTHCPKGHAYTGWNLMWTTRGDGRRFRLCRACMYAGAKVRRDRKRVAA